MPRVALSAYDRLFLAGHGALQRRGLPGHHCLIWLELSARPNRAALEAAYRQASEQSPLVDGRIGYSLLTGRAHWRYGERAPDIAPIAYHDLTASPRTPETQREILLIAWRERQDPSAGRQLRLFCFEQEDRATLVLRWPHYLMDLEGAQGFLLAMQQSAATRSEPPAVAGNAAYATQSFEAPLPYPPDWSGRMIRGWWNGARRHRAVARLASRQLPESPIDPLQTADFMTRPWTAEQTRQIVDTAKKQCAPGPMLHTRHLIAATARGLDDISDALGMSPGDHYLLPLPMLRPRRAPRTKWGCNDLIIATLVIRRDQLDDHAALDASLTAQIDAYSRGGDEAAWLFMSYVGLLRKSHYEWMLRRKRMMARCSIGFASFRADAWPAGFAGTSVDNTFACGLPTIPPGVMLTFARFGERLNLGVAFFPHVCASGDIAQLITRIEHHLGIA